MYCEMGDVFLFSLTIQPTYVEGACTNGTSSYITILKVWYTSKTRCTLLPASHCTIDNCCVDYVSITHGDSTREHICMDVCSWSNWNQSNIQLSVLLHRSMFSTLIWPTVGWMDFQWTFRCMLWSPKFSHCSANKAKLATCLWYSHWTFIHSFTVWKVWKACSKYIQVCMHQMSVWRHSTCSPEKSMPKFVSSWAPSYNKQVNDCPRVLPPDIPW